MLEKITLEKMRKSEASYRANLIEYAELAAMRIQEVADEDMKKSLELELKQIQEWLDASL